MDRKSIAVVGWYDHGNLGDEAFKVAFKSLFPEWSFTFFDKVPINWKEFDALFVGGGSFLDKQLDRINDVKIPTAFIGVGVESNTHPYNIEAMKRAKIVVARHPNPYGYHAPDLVFASNLPKYQCERDQITVLVNNHFSPHPNCEEWKLRWWDCYAVEMAQALDIMIKRTGLPIHFYPMCLNPHVDDRRAAAYIIDRMVKKEATVFHCIDPSERDLVRLIARSKVVVTQRFHGMVYSALLGTRFVGINGHQKMSSLAKELDWKAMSPYYGFTVSSFLTAIDNSHDISGVTKYCERAKATWRDMSALIRRELFG